MKRFLRYSVLMMIVVFLLMGTAYSADKVFYYHTDPAGTPLAMTDANGAVVWRADYRPFGEEQSIHPQTIENDMKFVGKEKDKETGLQYFGARYMKDEIGRFITVDPVGPVDPRTSKTNYAMLANPQRLNRYAYSLNNPYRYVDPDGRMPWLLPFLYNLLLPSSANAPESKEALTAPSQTAGQFTSGVAAMEATGLVVGRIVAGARSASPALSIEGRALLEARPVASALKGDAAHRSASFMREEAARNGTHFEIVGGDGVTRTLTQVEGTLNGQTGRFEYIVEKTGNLTHQRFVPNGSINGIPNTP